MRSEAQKAADKRYRETHKGALTRWTTWFKPPEFEHVETVLKTAGMSRAEFVRWAVAEWEKQH